MSKKLKVYLAGPDVFRENAKEYGEQLKVKLKEVGLKGLYPFDNEVNQETPLFDQAVSIYKANIKMIKKCDFVLANLDTFRGPSCDVGTAFEIGYAKALGKTVIGYHVYDSIVNYKAKVITYDKNSTMKSGIYKNIERFGLSDNLMIIKGCDEVYTNIDDAVNSIINRGKKK